MSQTQQPTQTQPPAGGVEPCPQCGALLAADQRYCLNCGRRRGAPRIDFTRYFNTRQPAAGQNGQVAAAADSAPPPEQKPQRDFAPLAAAAGIAVLGLMLLVGVLIGRGSNDESAPTQPTQVVVPQGEGSKSAASGEEKGKGALEAQARPSKKGKAAKTRAGTVKAPPAITASDSELKALEESSEGGNYSEESAKLPNEIATPGPAPPKDNKKPGGGSKGTTIE
jgi:hypothetical protein